MKNLTMTVEEMAEALGKSNKTIRRLIKQEAFPFARCAKAENEREKEVYLISRAGFENWINGKYLDTPIIILDPKEVREPKYKLNVEV